jgi:hypothetical protein
MRSWTGRPVTLLLAAFLALVIAACGSSSGSSSSSGQAGSAQAQSLLDATFSGSHAVNSGVLGFNLTLTPSGSNTIKGPISLGLTGPFQSRGTGQLPQSALAISIDALGHHGQLGIVSTGTAGYVTLKGVAYKLPAAEYQKLASSLSGAGGGTGGLAKLGIKPLHWLTAPSIVGTDSVGGTPTTHIRAKVDVAALLGDVSTLLSKAAASGATGTASLPTTLSPATRQKIAAEIKNPSVDIWTGASDRTLRKLAINLNVPVTGTISSLLGGLSSAQIGMTLLYAHLNQPQTVATPTNVRPFSQFTAQLRSIVGSIQGSLGAGGLGSGAGAGSATTGTTGATGAASVQKYSTCIQKAAGDVSKMQKCATLLQGG